MVITLGGVTTGTTTGFGSTSGLLAAAPLDAGGTGGGGGGGLMATCLNSAVGIGGGAGQITSVAIMKKRIRWNRIAPIK